MYEGFPIQQTNKGTWQHRKTLVFRVDYLRKKKKNGPLSGGEVTAFSEKMRTSSCFQVSNCQNCHCKMQPADLRFKSPENDNILISGRIVFYTAYISALGALTGGTICDTFTCGNSDKDNDGGNDSYSISPCYVLFYHLMYH